MSFHTGKQLVRVTSYQILPFNEGLGKKLGHSQARVEIGNTANEHLPLVYLVSRDRKPHALLTDLKHFFELKKWFVVTLVEKEISKIRTLCIQNIQESDLTQEECEEMAFRKTRDLPDHISIEKERKKERELLT